MIFLNFITYDVEINPRTLQAAHATAVEDSLVKAAADTLFINIVTTKQVKRIASFDHLPEPSVSIIANHLDADDAAADEDIAAVEVLPPSDLTVYRLTVYRSKTGVQTIPILLSGYFLRGIGGENL